MLGERATLVPSYWRGADARYCQQNYRNQRPTREYRRITPLHHATTHRQHVNGLLIEHSDIRARSNCNIINVGGHPRAAAAQPWASAATGGSTWRRSAVRLFIYLLFLVADAFLFAKHKSGCQRCEQRVFVICKHLILSFCSLNNIVSIGFVCGCGWSALPVHGSVSVNKCVWGYVAP